MKLVRDRKMLRLATILKGCGNIVFRTTPRGYKLSWISKKGNKYKVHLYTLDEWTEKKPIRTTGKEFAEQVRENYKKYKDIPFIPVFL